MKMLTASGGETACRHMTAPDGDEACGGHVTGTSLELVPAITSSRSQEVAAHKDVRPLCALLCIPIELAVFDDLLPCRFS